MRRGFLWLIGLIPVIAAAGCGAGGLTVTASHQGHTYRDAAGWTIEVPPGWHAARFSDSKDGITSAGVQLSNVRLPPPTLVPGFPIQVNGGVLPARGVGLIIATDTDPKLGHGPIAVPPLPAPDAPDGWKYWNAGSASAGAPYIETLWFRINGTTFIASAKIGPRATSHGLKAADAIVKSFR
jgi:uncharacterized protein YbdZ (MbtH family)